MLITYRETHIFQVGKGNLWLLKQVAFEVKIKNILFS